jgi:hypothetical protein
MNAMNSLEARLKCWSPRAPSAGVEQRLFGKPRRSAPSHSFGWLAPAAACALLVGALVRQPVEMTFSGESGPSEFAAMSLSNQNYAAYLPGSFKQEQNRWDTFEWTNRGYFNSSKHPFSSVQTDGSGQQ